MNSIARILATSICGVAAAKMEGPKLGETNLFHFSQVLVHQYEDYKIEMEPKLPKSSSCSFLIRLEENLVTAADWNDTKAAEYILKNLSTEDFDIRKSRSRERALDLAAVNGNAKLMEILMIHLGYISWSDGRYKVELFNDRFFANTFNKQDGLFLSWVEDKPVSMVACFQVAAFMRDFFQLNFDELVKLKHEGILHAAISLVIEKLQESAEDSPFRHVNKLSKDTCTPALRVVAEVQSTNARSSPFDVLPSMEAVDISMNAMTRADFIEAMSSLPLWTSAEITLRGQVLLYDSLAMFVEFVLNKKIH